MARSLSFGMTLLFLFLGPSGLAAQDDTYQEELAAANESLRKGRLSRAESLFEEILAGLEETHPEDRPDPATVRAARFGLLELALVRGRYEMVVKGIEGLDETDRSQRGGQILLAEALRRTGGYEAAQTILERRLAVDGQDVEARYRLADVLAAMGRRTAARATFEETVARARQHPPEDALQLSFLARALVELGGRADLEAASATAVQANRMMPDLKDPLVILGRLKFLAYREASGYPSGERDLLEVLKQGGDVEEALILLYRIRRSNFKLDPSVTESYLERALAVNPRSVPALLERASMLLGDRRFEEGARMLEVALAIDPRDRTALAYRAAAAHLMNRQSEEAEYRNRLAVPGEPDPEPDRLMADLLVTLYRFADAVPVYERALAIDPDHVDALQGLARARIYTGRGEEAVALLEKARRIHSGRVDPWRNNALAVEELLAGEYERVDDSGFHYVIHRDDLEVLRAYLLPLHAEAMRVLGARYQHMPKEPVRVEVLRTWDDFSVRTIGFRGFMALGACFGNLITLVSPVDADLRRQDFMWSATVWHEYAHVLTLALSRSRIPRWLTEGISVFEERQRNPAWERGMDRELLDAHHNGQIPPLRAMNSLFRGPRILFGYFLGGVIVDKLTREHGFDKVVELVKAYGEDRPAEEAFRSIFAESTRDFDRRLQQEIAERLKGLKLIPRTDEAQLGRLLDRISQSPGDLAARVQAGHAFVQRNNLVDAADQVRAILLQDPDFAPALLLRAELLRRRNAIDEAKELYRRGFAAGAGDFDARIRFGRMLEAEGDVNGAIEQYKAAKLCWPACTEQANAPELLLYRLYRAGDRIDEAMAELTTYVDRTGRAFQPRLDLAAYAKNTGDRAREARYLDEAIQIDPFMRELHVRLADALESLGQTEQALRELTVALAVRPAVDRAHLGRPPEQIPSEDAESERELRAELSLRRGKLLRILRRDPEAADALRRAVREAPGSAAADEARLLQREWEQAGQRGGR